MDTFIPIYLSGVVFFVLWNGVIALQRGLAPASALVFVGRPLAVMIAIAMIVIYCLLWPIFFPAFICAQWAHLRGGR